MGDESLEEFHVIQDMMDRAWENELALFLGSVRDDLIDGIISAEQAVERINQIKPERH